MYHGIPRGPIWQVLLPIVFTSWTTFRLYFRRPKELNCSASASTGASLQSGFDGCCMWHDLVESGCSAPMRICRNISSRVRKGAESLSLEYTSKDPFPEEWCPRIVRWCGSLPAFASHDKVVAFKLWEDTSSRSPVWGFRNSTNQRDASSEVTLRWLHFPSLLGDGRTAPRPKLAKSRDTASAIFSLNIPEGELGRMKRQNTPRFPLLAILDALQKSRVNCPIKTAKHYQVQIKYPFASHFTPVSWRKRGGRNIHLKRIAKTDTVENNFASERLFMNNCHLFIFSGHCYQNWSYLPGLLPKFQRLYPKDPKFYGLIWDSTSIFVISQVLWLNS